MISGAGDHVLPLRSGTVRDHPWVGGEVFRA